MYKLCLLGLLAAGLMVSTAEAIRPPHVIGKTTAPGKRGTAPSTIGGPAKRTGTLGGPAPRA